MKKFISFEMYILKCFCNNTNFCLLVFLRFSAYYSYQSSTQTLWTSLTDSDCDSEIDPVSLQNAYDLLFAKLLQRFFRSHLNNVTVQHFLLLRQSYNRGTVSCQVFTKQWINNDICDITRHKNTNVSLLIPQ